MHLNKLSTESYMKQDFKEKIAVADAVTKLSREAIKNFNTALKIEQFKSSKDVIDDELPMMLRNENDYE